MSVLLMNSAVMPESGHYQCKEINCKEFCELLTEAHKRSDLISYIGYFQNATLIQKWTGIKILLNRNKTIIKAGDYMLCMVLKYRIEDIKGKSKEVDETDFRFFFVTFEAEKTDKILVRK